MAKSKQRRKKSKVAASVSSPVQEMELKDQQINQIHTLIEEAESEMNSFNYDGAKEKCNEVLKLDSNNTKTLEMLAGIYIEQFKWKEAESIFLQCIELCPENGHSKYFSLGQICEGEKSLTFFRKGIQILEKHLENAENTEPGEVDMSRSTLMKNLSDAYCSIAEIFMTDCCFEENAEEKCLDAINNAVKLDPSNAEAYQCLANFNLVKENFEEAKKALEKSLSLWLPQQEEGDGGINEDSQVSLPVYDSRLKTSKLLIELEMFEEATLVLERLKEEDDEVTEVWYLLGWVHYLQGDENKQDAYYYLKKAKEVGVKTGMGDEDQLCHIEELLEELKDYNNDEEEDDDEVEWDSDASSDSDSNKMEA